MSGDVVIQLLEQDTVIQTVDVAGDTVLEVPAPSASPLITLITPGPAGPPGDTRMFIGDTPPDDTSMVWIKTSP